MSGMTVGISGVVGRKAQGIGDKGEAYRSITIDYMGGAQPLYGLSPEEWTAFPEEGQPVQVRANGRVDKGGTLRLSNVQLVEAPAARRAA